MDRGSYDAAGWIAGLFLMYSLLVIALMALTIWIYWRIFTKAGYNGALALFNFIPGVGQLVCVIILAFGRWPIEDRLAGLTSGGGPVAPPPPGGSLAI